MNRGSEREAFERMIQRDPKLAVDELSGPLSAQTASHIDPMLAVDTLEEFFPERQAADVEDYFAVADGPSTPVEDDSDLKETPRQVAFQSEIQRAAIEFQRFAEKFHAFASECQHRGAL